MHMASFSPFVHSRLDGKLAHSFTIKSDSQFQAPAHRAVSWRPRFAIHSVDDRHVGQLFISPLQVSRFPSLEPAQLAAYIIMCHLLIEAGYFIGIENSQLVFSRWTIFPGFVCDPVRQVYLIPEDS